MPKEKWSVNRAVGWGAAIGALWMLLLSLGNFNVFSADIQYVVGGAVEGAILFGLVAIIRNLFAR